MVNGDAHVDESCKAIAQPGPSASGCRRNAGWLNFVWQIVDKFDRRTVVAQEFKPGEIVLQSGIYTITRDRRTPTCRTR